MATVFKNFVNNDLVSTRTLLHESIPITGSIVSGTYFEAANPDNETNIKNYSHGLFQSVYDYPHLSSSANHLFDVSMGYWVSSSLSGTTGTRVQQKDKINLYNQMAQLLMGHDVTGNIRPFDRDGDLTGGGKMDSVFFLNFSRLLVKDEIKKGSFEVKLITGSADESDPAASRKNYGGTNTLTLKDHAATSSYKVNSPAGEYGLLFSSSTDAGTAAGTKGPLGHVYYQAGIAVITSSVFRSPNYFDVASSAMTFIETATGISSNTHAIADKAGPFGWLPGHIHGTDTLQTGSVEAMFVSASISGSCSGLRNALYNVSFNNTTELNSTIYFCRASHNEFNYSSNPTYLNDSRIRVKNSTLDQPVAYITTIGLYSPDNELLAVAKLSEPIKKTPETELTFRVRLDY
tara:strand:+ start:531 stop:1742 length:1212 start_codon:yes stop_codon:yes gene_type:complete